jgi:acyl carrier protein
MKAYFQGRQPPELLDRLATLRAADLLKESVDVVEFVLYLEEELRCQIGFAQIGPSLASMTFGELAAELCRLLDKA